MPGFPSSSKPDPMAREVDRLLAGLTRQPAAPESDRPTRGKTQRSSPAARRASRPKPRAGEVTRRDLVALWARLFLGVSLGMMILQWPYLHACGLPLVEYLGAVGMVMVSGAWIAVASWTRRHAAIHVLALLLVSWGVALAAHEILPRVGYAVQRWTWQC